MRILPRHLEIDSNRTVWVAEYSAGIIARFDAKAETFKECELPGPGPTPYGLGVDSDNEAWYSSSDQDVLGSLDPKIGGIITIYPFPHSENTIGNSSAIHKGGFGTALRQITRLVTFI